MYEFGQHFGLTHSKQQKCLMLDAERKA